MAFISLELSRTGFSQFACVEVFFPLIFITPLRNYVVIHATQLPTEIGGESLSEGTV